MLNQYYPVTLSFVAVYCSIAFVTRTHLDPLSKKWLDQFAFAPSDIWLLNLERLFTSAFLTHGKISFWIGLFMLTFTLGAVEFLAGSMVAFGVFWAVHILTLLIVSLFVALPLHRLGFSMGSVLVTTKDVGPSAGYFGCFGFALARWGFAYHWGLAVLVGLMLMIAFFIPPNAGESKAVKLHGDIAHVIAFALGILMSF